MLRLTPLGAAVLIGASVLAVFGPPGPLAELLTGGLVGLIVLALLLARRRGAADLVVRRHVPAVATRGEAVEVVHEVENVGDRVVRDLVVTELGPDGRRTSSLIPFLPPGLAASARGARLHPVRRGPLRFEGVSLRWGDPFGLFVAETHRAVPGELLCRPRPRRADGVRIAAVAGRRSRAWDGHDDWSSVREWRQGDPLARVHWRLTARRGYPVVRTFDDEREAATLLILDRRVGSSDDAEGAFERAVGLAAGIGLAIIERGAPLAFRAPGEPGPIALDELSGRAGVGELLDALALIAPDAGEGPLDPTAAIPPGMRAIVVSASAPPDGTSAARLDDAGRDATAAAGAVGVAVSGGGDRPVLVHAGRARPTGARVKARPRRRPAR